MKYLKRFNEGKNEYPESEIIEFVRKISKMVSINWDLYDIDIDAIDDLLKDTMPEVDYVEILNPDVSKTDIEYLVVKLLNIGYTLGVEDNKRLSRKYNFDFEDFFEGVSKLFKIDQIASKRLSYNGPDIKSSSILAVCNNIKDTMKDIKNMVERYYTDIDSDIKYPEVTIILGKVYQYGYGIGKDTGHSGVDKFDELLKKYLTGDTSVEADIMKLLKD